MPYRKNLLKKNVLITPEDVIFHAPTKHEVDHRMIISSIIVAEERFLKTELGYDLYEELIAAKNVLITSANKVAQETLTGLTLAVDDIVNGEGYLTPVQRALWDKHLWKLTAECVMVSAYPEGFVQYGSEGTLHNNPPAGLMVTSGHVVPLLSSLKWVVEKKVKDRIDPLIRSMHEYICKNEADFPLYGKECESCKDSEADYRRKFQGIAMDLYDDVDRAEENRTLRW